MSGRRNGANFGRRGERPSGSREEAAPAPAPDTEKAGPRCGGAEPPPSRCRRRGRRAGGKRRSLRVGRGAPRRVPPLPVASSRSALFGGGMAGGLRAPLLAVLALLLAASRAALAVSFYGDSFVALKMTEASCQTTLQLRFLTSKPHGLLFLAAGKRDYCLMELQSGNLQLRINFGMGEQILRSRQRSRLNDLAWHLVELHHERDNVTLLIDKNDRTTAKMPGFLYELNIDHGFYLGGTTELDVPYLVGGLPSFRGCIDDVLFNQQDILMPLRSTGFKKVHEVSVGCSDEFFAGEDEPISFFSSRSYVSFPLWNVDGEGILEFALQTSAARGLLLYHPGQEGDFIAMEVEDGLIKAYIGKHRSITHLSSLRSVNDSHWHYIKLKFTAEYLQLTLDKESVEKLFPPQNKLPLLTGSLYVGGVDDSKRLEVIKLELPSVFGKNARGRSFKGCLRDLKVNSEKKSLKNVQITKDISAGCEAENAFNTNLSLEMAVKYPTVKAAPTLAISPENSVSLGQENKNHLLVLSNLIVQEGGQASLESKHIQVNLDFQKLGINLSQVLFEIKEPPSYGNLRLDIEPVQEVNMFTLHDVWQGKILYIHGGSEDTYDYFNFSISANNGKIVPPYLQRNEEYMFAIVITPVNDAPEIMLAEGNLLLLIENSKKRLTSDLIKVLDNDTDPLDLSLSVLGNLNANAGYLENSKHPGKAITTFSNEDLQKGDVFFVHTGVRNSRIVLRANDGEKVSNTVVLRVMAIPLDYRVVINTGIKLVQGATVLISPRHLTVETNANLQELEIRYEITDAPQFGEVQRQHSRGEWKQASSFSQRSIQRSRVRYCSTFKEIQLENITDQFKFKVSIGNRISEEYVFPVQVKWLRYSLLKYTPLEIEKFKKKYLNSDNLFAVLVGQEVPEDELHFRLLSLPKSGQILLNDQTLKEDSVFSQKDIADQKVAYELISRYHEDNHDSFKFLISTKYLESNIFDFEIYIKSDFRNIILINNGLTVTEGEGELITSSKLFVQALDNKTFQYTVLKFPTHGKLKLINISDSFESNGNLTTFTNKDITDKRLMYVHDDSETVFDEFLVRASSEESREWANFDPKVGLSSVEIKFNISVQLKNDEKPIRVVDKVFNIVRNGQRLLTLADLCYHDPDSDFEDGQLLYTRRGISNGDLVLTNDSLHRLYQFKQEDLEQKQVLFIHHGADFGRFVLFVTDGKHYTSFLLEVNATDPYISLANNTGLMVQKGKEEIVTTANLSATTNQDIRNDHEITFEITTFPKYGRISVNGLMIDSFTQLDLIRGYVTYRHDNSNNLIDMFNFTVYAKNIHLDSAVNVRMYLESHHWPPRIVNNNSLLVEEGKPVKISKGKLQVAYENSSPSEIVFTVRQLPSHGYIRKFLSAGSYLGADQKPVLTFTQQDVDEGKVQYVQTVSGQLSDCFSLDVTNGVQTVNGIEISVDIIPRMIPLKVKNFTVVEGSSKALVEDYLNISSRHFTGLSCEIILVDQPKHGYFEDSNAPGIKLSKFTKKQVWVGSVTEITTDDLCAEDKDSSPSDLIYSITPPSNGHLALKSSPNESILSFTQAHIIERQLVFVHNGAMSGGFSFQVTDGLNSAPRQIFSITARTLVISLEVNKGLTVFPGSRKPISQHDLKAVTSDVTSAGNRTINFLIVVSPKLGRLIRTNSDNTTQEILSFTQSMVNEGVIMYEHSEAELADWSAEDFFMFTVSSPPSILDPQMFHIIISYEIPRHDRNSRLLANTGTVVQEGGRILINKTHLDASNLLIKLPEGQRSMYEVWYQVVSLPQHGTVIVGERNVTKEKPNFSQYILNKFGIVYVHDNSESLMDNFTFAVWLNLKTMSATKPHGEVLEEVFNITVIPVNDQPPELKTKRLHLKVLQGDMSVLGSENLKVEDLDNTPAELKYSIVSNPNNGYLAMKSNLSISIQDFTQADIDSGRVWFVQDGSSSSGVFYFSVTDGKHRPLYKLFSLEVVPIALVLVNLTDVALLQGQTSVTITNTQLSAVTNGKSTNIMYEITQPLKYGHLMIENEQVTKFEQADLNSGRLSYHLSNFTMFKEVLVFMIFTAESNLTEQVLNITMKPLVQVVSDMQISNQAVYKLRRNDLDASELANLTNSNPRFEVIVPPAHGRIVKKRFVNDAVFEDIQTFTQTDIDGGAVLLSIDTNMTGIDLLNDSFTFVLRADDVQPAVGHFEYSIVPCSPPLVQNFTAEVPIITSMTTLKIPTTSNGRMLVFSHDEVPTVAPKKTAPGMWLGRKRWGNQLEEGPSLNLAVGTRGSAGTETTDQVNAMSSREQVGESSNPWYIIIPLVLVSVLLIIAVISVCILLMCQKKEKAKPLVKNQTNVVLSSPSHCLERSLTVPAVTVTPLLKGAEGNTSSALMAARHEQLLPMMHPPTVEQPLQNSWLNLDPEMIQYCRKTNPTLKRSQYWV
ncbi:chondroitin sulfate proteoglycan 4-like isoform X2 [Coturnix japonica]|uniref:chondroitin sulfate proteoglycan 4-like isoform X2 n=1 Tax=Coturnix japonica TaxID=93934 RepID=UPI0013A5F014|nr:chondroitin sulfate proteoglycan 4-like isoform X2 [Coturnix japonica]